MKRFLLCAASLLALAMFSTVRVSAQTWTGTTPAAAASAKTDDEKTVYLWNVNKKCFLEKGGRWGTEAIQGTATNGMAFLVETSSYGNTTYYRLNTQMNAQGDATGKAYLGFMGITTGGSQTDKYNYYLDRKNNDDAAKIAFTFTGSASGYTISYNLSGTTYYMCAAYNSSSTTGNDITTSSAFADTKTIAINAFTSSAKSNDTWQLVTKKERDEYFAKSVGAGVADAGVTYYVKDYSFSRRDLEISNWKAVVENVAKEMVNGRYSDGKQDLSPNQAIPVTSSTSTTQYQYTYKGTCSGTSNKHENTYTTAWTTTTPSEVAKTMTRTCTHSDCNRTLVFWTSAASVTLTLDESQTKTQTNTQTSTTNEGYTYYVGNGIDGNDGGQEQPGNAWTANIHGKEGKLYQQITVPAAGHYRVTCKGLTTKAGTATFYAQSGNVTESQKLFETSAVDVHTASYIDGWTELQADNYFSAVTIYVAKNGTLEFGVEVKDGEADSWACFDDFEIEYVDNGEYYVVLDEQKETVDYIDAQKNNEKVKEYKVTAYLHRSFTPNVWNTIVLPFDVNRGSLISAFGAGTTISKFVGAVDQDNPHVLYFEPATSIKKDSLYLIIPTTAEPSGLTKVTGTVTDYTLEGKYYQLSGVTFTRDGNTPETVSGDTGKETYENQTNLVFTGTYIKKENIIPANSYLLKAGTEDVEGSTGTWYYRTLTSSSRAFRGWLQPEEKKTANVESIVINGVTSDLETTAIEGLTIDTTPRMNGNIYNLSGQLVRRGATTTEGLAKGLYIVNGKKIVVR